MTDLDTVTPCPLSRAILSRGSRHWNEIINVVLAGEPDNHGPVTCNWPIVWVQVSVLDNVTMLCLLRTLNNVLCLETAVPAYTPHPHCIHYMLRLRLTKRTKKKSSQLSSCFYVHIFQDMRSRLCDARWGWWCAAECKHGYRPHHIPRHHGHCTAAHHRKDRIRSQRRRREETEDRCCSQGDRGNLLGLGHSRF